VTLRARCRTLGAASEETPEASTMATASLRKVGLPDFGHPKHQPTIGAARYEARIEAARRRAHEAGLDALIVYGDREHAANLTYLTNYDPRFEEALLILTPGRKPALLVGNEGWDYSAISPVDFDRIMFQSLSLPAQPRDRSRPLDDILRDRGVRRGQRVGLAGWKYFGPQDGPTASGWSECPSYIVDTLRALVGDGGRVANAGALFMDASTGLRAINEAEQLAVFEFSAAHGSQGIRNVLFGLRPGMSEFDACRLMGYMGLPPSYYHIVTSGERTRTALAGPSAKTIAPGDPLFMAFGAWGSNTVRAGFVTADAAGLPVQSQDYVEQVVAPYYRAIVAWYETIGIGVFGAAIYDAVMASLGGAVHGIALNPGHLIHLEEWLHSPIYAGSTETLKSGMALQVDVIPLTREPYFGCSAEDGIALADAALREEIADRYPEAWSRIRARRAFMADVLGIRLRPEVLPFSNIQGFVAPFLLDPARAMVVER
jgi:Xaa-Pro aminopeptidase